MPDLINDGMTTVVVADAVSNLHTPTVAECNAGNDWTLRMTPDGLQTDPTTADVDTSSLASTQNSAEAGRRSWDIQLTFKRGALGSADDAPYRTLKYKTYKFVIIRRGVAYGTAFAAGQQVEVYPVVCGERANIAPAANEVMKFSSPMKLTSDADTDALVAA